MIGLLAWRPKEHMQSIADDFCDRALVKKYNVGHTREVVVQQRSENAWLQRLHQRSKSGDIGKERRNLPALAGEIDRVGLAGQPLREVGRKIARERCVSALGLQLTALCIAKALDVRDGL